MAECLFTHDCSLTQALPPELLTEVLASLPEVSSLVSAALTCRTLYQLATDEHLNIPRRVISNEIAPLVILEAFTAVDARHRDGWLLSWLPHKRPVTCEDLLQGTASFPQYWSLTTCVHMSRLHSKIQDLSNQFAQSALDGLRGAPKGITNGPLSNLERCRIETAFYRVETYSALYEIQPVHYHWQRNLTSNYFRRYATWENEQFACIWNWLKDEAWEGVERLSVSDVGWQGYMKHVVVSIPAQNEFLARQGIHLMHSLIHTKEDGYLPIPLNRIDPRRTSTSFFVSTVLDDLKLVQEDLSPAIQYAMHPTYGTPLQRPLGLDSDPGPEDAWCWSHPQLQRKSLVFGVQQHRLRRHGYVLWDRARISKLLETPYVPPYEGTEQYYVDHDMDLQYRRMMLRANRDESGHEVPRLYTWAETNTLLDGRAEESRSTS